MITKISYNSHSDWLQIRSHYIGGSDAAAVVGMNPYTSPYALWAEKTGKVPPFEGSITTEVGAYLEDFVAKYWEKETGKKVRKDNHTMVNSLYPWACANVDRRIVGENAILEIKTTNSLPRMKLIHGGEFPDEWYCQMMHYLAVTEAEKAYLAVLVNGREFYTFELERSQEEIDALMGAEKEFWKHVEDGTPPEADGSKPTSDAIDQIYASATDDEKLDLTLYKADLQRYLEYGKMIKDIKENQEEIANRIKLFMGESSKGEADGIKVNWYNSSKMSFDSKRFMADHPETDFAPYFTKSSSRTFKVTGGKDKK